MIESDESGQIKLHHKNHWHQQRQVITNTIHAGSTKLTWGVPCNPHDPEYSSRALELEYHLKGMDSYRLQYREMCFRRHQRIKTLSYQDHIGCIVSVTEEVAKVMGFAHLHLIACELWQSINPSLVFPGRKRLHANWGLGPSKICRLTF